MAEHATGEPQQHGNYRNLEAWSAGLELAEAIFAATRGLRPEDEFTLGVQIRRAALSIPSNIAEGYCRRSSAARLNHLLIASGSHGELETQLELAFRTGLIDSPQHVRLAHLASQAGKLLTGLIHANQRRLANERKPRTG